MEDVGEADTPADQSDACITEEDIHYVCKVHHQLLTCYTHSDWLRPESSGHVTVKDVVRPALHRYIVAAALFKKCFLSLC